MINRLKKTLVKNLSNLPGWRTRRKIVVFEADDWGSIRMPGKATYESLKKDGFDVDRNHFNRYDTLADRSDLAALFDVLDSVKDKNGKPAGFTAVSVVANPDFNKIKASGFTEYHYEPFTETLKRYYPGQDVIGLWKQGIAVGLITPQFHGREHFSAHLWLKALQAGDKTVKALFDHDAIGLTTPMFKHLMSNYMAAYDYEESQMPAHIETATLQGLDLFEHIFGYRARHFTSTSMLHNNAIEGVLKKAGIDFIDKAKVNFEVLGGGKYKKEYHKLGRQNKHKQTYITRNCLFEPTQPGNTDWVASCLNEIKIAFRWGKPAIISSHRVNYVGGIDRLHRDKSLQELKRLLKEITQRWPEVEFLSVVELGDIINK